MPIRVPTPSTSVGQYLPYYLAYYPEALLSGPGGGDSGGGVPPVPPLRDPRRLWLESSTHAWRPGLDAIILPGATGLGLPSRELVTAASPGVVGTTLQEIKVKEREVFLPIHLSSDERPEEHLDGLAEFEQIALDGDTAEGALRMVATSHRGERELGIVYTGGLEGDEGQSVTGSMWCRLGLKFLAPDPWWRDRQDQEVVFQVAPPAPPLVGAVGATDALWPGMLASSVVLGQGMEVQVRSAIDVYPTLELTGPMDSFVGSMDTGWSVEVPDGVPAGSTLRIVTDPRRRSIRMDDALAAGLVARGSQLRPFSPGRNVLNVLAAGANEETQLRLSWRGGWRTAWGS